MSAGQVGRRLRFRGTNKKVISPNPQGIGKRSTWKHTQAKSGKTCSSSGSFHLLELVSPTWQKTFSVTEFGRNLHGKGRENGWNGSVEHRLGGLSHPGTSLWLSVHWVPPPPLWSCCPLSLRQTVGAVGIPAGSWPLAGKLIRSLPVPLAPDPYSLNCVLILLSQHAVNSGAAVWASVCLRHLTRCLTWYRHLWSDEMKHNYYTLNSSKKQHLFF